MQVISHCELYCMLRTVLGINILLLVSELVHVQELAGSHVNLMHGKYCIAAKVG